MEVYGLVGTNEYIKSQNEIISTRAKGVTKLFTEGGFRTSVLKGQRGALLYPIQITVSGEVDYW